MREWINTKRVDLGQGANRNLKAFDSCGVACEVEGSVDASNRY